MTPNEYTELATLIGSPFNISGAIGEGKLGVNERLVVILELKAYRSKPHLISMSWYAPNLEC